MKKLIFSTTALFLSIVSFAQITENRQAGNFSKLKVSQSIEVYYTVSNTKSVKIETDLQQNMQYIKTEVVGETLKLYVENNFSKKSRNNNWNNGIKFKVLKITVFGPNLNEINASSSGFIKFQNTNKSDNLDIDISSSGTIKGNFECNSIKIQTSSSGEFNATVQAKSAFIDTSSSSSVTIEGKATNLECKASSSSDCNLKEFKVENATVASSSSSSVTIHISKSIDAKASSSGRINFYGNPANVTKEKNSSGSITQK